MSPVSGSSSDFNVFVGAETGILKGNVDILYWIDYKSVSQIHFILPQEICSIHGMSLRKISIMSKNRVQ